MRKKKDKKNCIVKSSNTCVTKVRNLNASYFVLHSNNFFHVYDEDLLFAFQGYDLLQPQPSASQEFDAANYIPVPAEVKRMTVNKDTGETLLHRAARMGYVVSIHDNFTDMPGAQSSYPINSISC